MIESTENLQLPEEIYSEHKAEIYPFDPVGIKQKFFGEIGGENVGISQ